MKLTSAQLRALEAVKAGSVTLYDPIRGNRDNVVDGARKDVITRLVKMGLIQTPRVSMWSRTGAYTLTTDGRKALEEQCKQE